MTLIGALADPFPATAQNGATTVGDPAAGEAIYLATCASCHGPQAGGTADAPGLRQAGTALIDFMLRTGRMPLSEVGQPIRRGAPLLDQQQVADVIAFLAPLTDGPAIPDVVVSGADLGRGFELYRTNCAACHGATGTGTAIGGGIVAPDLDDSTSQDVAEAIVGGPPPMPRFSFSPDDVASIDAYVQFLRTAPSPGGSTVTAIGPVAEGFAAGFVGLVGLLVIVRWIGRGSRLAQERPAPAGDQPYSGEERR